MKTVVLKWHPEASADLNGIVAYCSTAFSRDTARRVRDKLLSAAELLRTNPFLGPIEPLLEGCTTLEYRSLVADTYTKIIYTVHADYIYIHLLWDVRQDEERMSKVATDRYTLFEHHNRYSVNEPAVPYGSAEER